jgi:transposase
MLPAIAPRTRRRFSREFKRQLVEQCQSGVSVAGIAMSHGINPNQLHRWIRETRTQGMELPERVTAAIKLMPVSVQMPQSSDVGCMIEITLTGKNKTVAMRWPASAASTLAPLLADWLK